MNIWMHSAIAGISLVAMVAVAAAGVAVYEAAPETVAMKSDLLQIVEPTPEPSRYVTVEVRSDRHSVLSRFPVPETANN